MTPVTSFDPRTGASSGEVVEETSQGVLEKLCAAAAEAAPVLPARRRADRAHLLEMMADQLEANRDDIVRLADRETALGAARLNGELTRTCYQLGLFAEVLHEGSYLEATIDHAADTPAGPRPDLRRMLIPIGPVAVFAASNFPLAFSVPGGDTVSALAAGNPVIVKAHPSHPATSQLCGDLLQEVLAEWGAPTGTLALIHGFSAGSALVQDARLRAVSFTGSVTGGRALHDLIAARKDPIPLYAELGSINPVIVTQGAAKARGEAIGRELTDSYTLGAGQFCTKPGFVLLPTGADGDLVVQAMIEATTSSAPQWLLNQRIAVAYRQGTARLSTSPNVAVIAEGSSGQGVGYEGIPRVLSVDVANVSDALMEECFGPVTVLVRYSTTQELLDCLRRLPASLTTSIHAAPSDLDLARDIGGVIQAITGRLVFNGYPTGVAVSWAQHHGGPWPSTNSTHTSVGATSIRRFLRPFAWQSAPEPLLPEELRDGSTTVPRRENGQLHLPTRQVD